MNLRFEWDEMKAVANARKHGLSFEEATTIFSDPNTITIFDVEHLDEEDRFIDIGLSASGRIRVISCRKATPAERRQYEQRVI